VLLYKPLEVTLSAIPAVVQEGDRTPLYFLPRRDYFGFPVFQNPGIDEATSSPAIANDPLGIFSSSIENCQGCTSGELANLGGGTVDHFGVIGLVDLDLGNEFHSLFSLKNNG
jgi:hypothetical protein